MECSFIIPAYNAEKTIIRCLDSIYALNLNDSSFEVIVIDDCSTDNTVSVISEYASKQSNLILLRQSENHRQGAARNKGVDIAKGKFISFVDSDDTVAPGILSAIELATNNQLDMTAFHYVSVNEDGNVVFEKEHLSFREGELFSGIDLQNKHSYWCSGPVAYIYNTRFLQQVNYPFAEDVLYEDSDFVAVHLYYAKRMSYSKECGYIVYNRIGSTTRSISYKGVSDYLLLGTRMLRFYETIIEDNANIKHEKNKFASVVLEGACYNVVRAARRLVKLNSINDVFLFYERVDLNINRAEFSANSLIHKFYWNKWTSLVMKHKYITIAVVAVAQPIYKLIKRFKSL